MDIPAVRTRLLDWYDTERRELPWRGTRDPYAVWVSEVMLQQTRVETVRARYVAWMDRFPTVACLAGASEDEVLALWSGLGYYRRARNLWRGARVVVAGHDGRMPADAADLAALPGVGRYTAGAIASIAYGQAVPAVDGNVLRVLSRLDGIQAPVDKAPGRRAVEALAARLVHPGRPGDWNQALMDLGSAVCTPRTPSCASCPIAGECVALRDGTVEALPATAGKRTPRREGMVFARIAQGGRVLLVQEPGQGLLGGLWRLPGGSASEPLEDHVRSQTGLTVRLEGHPRQVRHVFTHRVWDMTVHDAALLEAEPEAGVSGALPARWVDADALEGLGVSTAARKTLRL